MATFSPIPQGGSQGALFVTSLTTGTEQIRPGTNTVFIGQTLTGNLTLMLPAAKYYAAGTSMRVNSTLPISTGQILLAPRAQEANTVNGGTTAIVALSSVGDLDVFSDGVSGWSFSPALSIGTAPGTVMAGNDSRSFRTFTPEMFADGTADDTTALQAAVSAACANAPARVLLSRMYFTSATVTGTRAITLDAMTGGGITSTVPTGDILAFIPTVTPTQGNPAGSIQGLRIRDLYLEASVAKTSGAALHVRYSQDARIERIKIGTFQSNPTGTPPNPYNGIFAEYQDNFVVLTPNICTSHEGFNSCGLGATGSNGGAFAFGGYIGGSGKMYGTYTTGSVGIHLTGGNGGFEIGDLDCGQWETGLLVDTSVTNYSNRELFVGRCFFDAASKNGVYINTNSINRLELQHAWICSVGRIGGVASSAGYQAGNIENGAGIVVKSQGGIPCQVSGSTIFNNSGSGLVCYGENWHVSGGSEFVSNGLGSGGGHGFDARGNGDLAFTGNFFSGNGTASVGNAVNITQTPSCVFAGNDFNGSVRQTANPYTPISGLSADNTLQVVRGNVFGPPETFLQATTNYFGGSSPANVIPGVYAGYNTTPRILLSDGTPAHNVEIDNYGGARRTFQNGTVLETLHPDQRLEVQSISLIDIGALPASGTGPQIVFSQGHYYGWNGQWHQLDN